MAALKDSGARREFESGAVRDCADDKGRCDLLPLFQVGNLLGEEVCKLIHNYIKTGCQTYITEAIEQFCLLTEMDLPTAILEVSKQYEGGCIKYGERNWEKGIPLHCFIDSGTRHYLKWLRADTDEPHDRAFIWNMLGALWTQDNMPNLIDLPFAQEQQDENK